MTGRQALILTIALLVMPAAALGGDLIPSEPVGGSTLPTLETVYNRLIYGEEAPEPLAPGSEPAPVCHDLNAVMAAAPAPDNTNGAGPGDVAWGRTFWSLRTDGAWGLQTGTADPVAACSGDADPSQVLDGFTFSSSLGRGLGGSMPISTLNITPSVDSHLIPMGYHDGTGKVFGDPGLVPENILAGQSIFSVTGDPAVKDTDLPEDGAMPGEILSGKTAWVNGVLVTGTAEGVLARTGDAESGHVLDGFSFSNAAASGSAGTMPDQGSVTIVPQQDDQVIPQGFHDGTGSVPGDENLDPTKIVNGTTIFGVTGSGGVADTSDGTAAPDDLLSGRTAWVDGQEIQGTRPLVPVVQTGDTYDQPDPLIVGEDGELQKGYPLPQGSDRFYNNFDGTVTDTMTGLVWLQNPNFLGTRKYWAEAVTECYALEDGPYVSDGSAVGDWRLPNINELFSLVDMGNSAVSLSAGHCFGTVGITYHYWTATTCASDEQNAFGIRLDGRFQVIDMPKTFPLFVWPVRDYREPVPEDPIEYSYEPVDDYDGYGGAIPVDTRPIGTLGSCEQVSFSFWVSVTDLNSSTFQGTVSSNAFFDEGIFHIAVKYGLLEVYLNQKNDGTARGRLTSREQVETNKDGNTLMTHFVITGDVRAGTLELFRDGVSDDTETIILNTKFKLHDLVMGGEEEDLKPERCLSGRLGRVLIVSRVLTLQEIQDLYADTPP